MAVRLRNPATLHGGAKKFDQLALSDGTAGTYSITKALLFEVATCDGICLQAPTSTSAQFIRAYLGPVLTNSTTSPTNGVATFPSGTLIEAYCIFQVSLLPTGSTINGFGFASDSITAANLSATTSTGVRVLVGINSSGDFRIITDNGSSVTNTSMGVTYTAGSTVIIKISYLVGTGVTAQVENSAFTTVTTTLPTSGLTCAYVYKGTTSTAGPNNVRTFGAEARITGAGV